MFRTITSNTTSATSMGRSLFRTTALLGAAAATTGLSLIPALPAGAQTKTDAKEAAARILARGINATALKDHGVSDAELRDLMARTDGILHKYCQDPTSGSLDAYDTMVKELAGLVGDLIKDRPNGSESQREAAFKTLSVIYFAMLFGGISLPPACGLIGTGVGAIAGVPAADFAGASIPAGTLIGFGSGMVLAGGEVTVATMIIVSTSLELNDKYPPKDADSTAGTASSARAQALTAATAPASGSHNQAQAGPYESLLVNLVCTAFSDRLLPVAQQWDNAPGLSSTQRDFLRAFKALQPIAQQVARIKTTRKLATNAGTALPPSAWMQDAERILSADTAVAERGWLDALGIGALEANVRNGQLAITMPPVLRAAGAPATVNTNLAHISLKVGGQGGALDPYLRASVVAGNFDITAGDASIIRSGADHDRIKVSFKVRRGSRLGSASLGLRWNGPEQALTAFAPSLTSDATADAFFRVTGQGLQLDRIDVGPVGIGYDMPGMPQNIPGLSDLVKGLTSSLQTALQQMVKDVLGMGPAMASFNSLPAASLTSALNATTTANGLGHVVKVESLMLQGGKLHARALVSGATIDLTKQMVQQASAAYRDRIGRIGAASGIRIQRGIGSSRLQP